MLPCSHVPCVCHCAPPSFFASAGAGGLGVDFGAGAVGIYKHFVGYTADVGFGDLVDFVELEEELTPIAVAGLVLGQRVGESLVVGQAAEEIGAGAGLVHRELRIGDVGGFELVNFFPNSVAHLGRRVAGERDGIKREEARDIFRRERD